MCDIDEDIEFFARDLEIIAQRLVRCGHEGAEFFEIGGFECSGRFDGAGDFAHDMAGAAVDRIAEFFPMIFHIGHRDIAP